METIKQGNYIDQRYLLTNKTSEGETVTTNDKKTKEQIEAEEHAYKKMCSDLPLYQDKIKRDKSLYKEEFNKFMEVFTPKFYSFLESPSSTHENIKEIIVFLAHLGHIFPHKLAFIPNELLKLIEHSHSIIHPDTRLAIIESFNLLRKKDLLNPKEVLPLMFQLLTCQDKQLRQKLQDFIITDLTRINEKGKNHKINTFIRNKCLEMLNSQNYKAARKTLNIMILLYKKKVWDDDKAVNDISRACCNEDRKIGYAACKFFLSEYEDLDEENESETNEMDELKNKYKLLGKGNSQKQKKKKKEIKKLIKAVERRESRKDKEKNNKNFMPIDLIKDPMSICEKLFNRLEQIKNRKNYSLKMVMMRLIGRLIGRHKIVLPRFFYYSASLIRPRQDELTTILASIAEATHYLIPPSDLNPIINELYDKFIDSSFPHQYITLGLNALREIVERSPYCISYDQYSLVEDMRRVKNKSVAVAVKGFMNMVKDVNPGLIENKTNTKELYGIGKVNDSIEGTDLLKYYDGLPQNYKLECNQLLTDSQLKKIRLLRLKENAEAVQRIRLHLTGSDIKGMIGEYVSKDEKRKDDLKRKDMKIRKSKKRSEEDDDEENRNDNCEDGDDLEDECDDGSDISVLDEDDEELNENEENDEEELDEEDENEDEEDVNEDDDDDDLNEEDDDEYEDEEEEESYHSENSITYKKRQAKEDLDNILDDEEENTKQKHDSDEESEKGSFIDENQLDTFKHTRREQLEKQRHEEKEKFKLKRKKKSKGQKTNQEAKKNKPTQMIIYKVKRTQIRKNDKNLTMKIKTVKRQLGRLKRGNMILKKKGMDVKKTKKKLTNKKKNRV
jgi:protein SDA1